LSLNQSWESLLNLKDQTLPGATSLNVPGYRDLKVLMAGVVQRARIPARSMSLEVRAGGLAVTTETTASLTSWEGIDRIVVSDTHAFFYLNNMAAHILPHDERDFEEFVESARSYRIFFAAEQDGMKKTGRLNAYRESHARAAPAC